MELLKPEDLKLLFAVEGGMLARKGGHLGNGPSVRSMPSTIIHNDSQGADLAPQAPRSTIGELARQADVAPRELLDAALAAGVQVFWHEGQQFRTAAYLETYLRLTHAFDPIPELQLSLSDDQAQRLAADLDVDSNLLLPPKSGKPVRKFASSEGSPPATLRRGKIS